MIFSPAHDTLLLKSSKETAKSSIVVSDPKKNLKRGEVVSVGPGRWSEVGKLIPRSALKGDIVYYPSYAETPIHLEGEQYVLVKEADIFGWIRK